jgi:hypothetical protein
MTLFVFPLFVFPRQWRARSSRELAGLSYEQLKVRLSRFATAETLVKPVVRRKWRKAVINEPTSQP